MDLKLKNQTKIDKNRLLFLLLAGTIQEDRGHNKKLSMHIINSSFNLPIELLNEPGYDEYMYAMNILDFEYGVYDAVKEDYPNWVKRYETWKLNKKI